MEYLLKVSAVISIFYVCYKIFLQGHTFFNQNRAFLILGIFTAFALPFLVIPIYVEYTPVDITNYDPLLITANENIQTPFSIFNYLPTIYLLGVACFSIRFLIQLISLGLVISKSKKEKHGKYTYIKTHKDQSPFSFFNWIVFNPNSFKNSELEQIIIHEKIHANQKHSIDVLLMQLSCIALWFNPFIWFYTKALKQNLEFIADYETQGQIDCKKSYQTTLLKTSLPSHQMALTNNFHTSLIKKRIVMLHKSKSKNINLFKYTLVIPLLITFIFNCNTKVIAQSKDDANVNITAESDSALIVKLKDSDLPLIIIDGEVSSQSKLELLNHSNTGSINILKGKAATEAYGKKGENGVMLITTKKQSPWKVSTKRNKNVLYATRDTIYLNENPKVSSKRNKNVIYPTIDTIYVNENPNILQKLLNEYNEQPLYILDDKEISKKELELLDEQTINSVSIRKADLATNKYGERGENGAIIIKSRTENSRNNPYVKIVKAKLYIVDGEEIKEADFYKIDPENIKSINFFKAEPATKKYGNKGKNGAIEITTKNGKWETRFIIGKPMNNIKVNDSIKTLKVVHKIEIDKDKQPLIYVNEIKIDYANLDDIDQNNIKYFNVLTDKNATDKYGNKGKNGVIEIFTK